MEPDTTHRQKIAFGRFCLDRHKRVLLADGQPITLQSRPFDILEFLVTSRDRVVSRDEIVAQIWHGQTVAENNLTVQISALRRALTDVGAGELIITIPGRGYRFVGEVIDLPPPIATRPEPALIPPNRHVWRARLPLIATICAAAALIAIAVSLDRRAPPAPPRLSIVVLPFRNLSDDRHDDYLADAISDDLTTDLAQIPASLVIARETADSYKGRAIPADQIGRTLNVRYLLEGSLRVEATSLHINAQLIEAASANHLWAEKFDVPRTQLAQARDIVVRHIASTLHITIETIEAANSLRDRPNNPDALDLFLRARAIFYHGDDLASLAAAQSMLEQAITKSPDFIDALITEGRLLISKVADHDDPDEAADLARAQTLIQRAAALAPTEASVLGAQAYLAATGNDLTAVQTKYEAALAADPNFTRAHTGLALCDWRLGRYDQAILHLTEAMRQDPIGPSAAARQGMIGMADFMLGQTQQAQDILNQQLTPIPPGQKPDDLGRIEWNRLFLIAAYAANGNTTAARTTYTEYAKTWPNRTVWRILSYFTAAQSHTPGYARLRDALTNAGMPLAADEHANSQVPPYTEPKPGGDFDDTPTTIPGATTADAATVKALLTAPRPPIIVDVGRGVAIPPGALWELSINQRDTAPIQRAIAQARAAAPNPPPAIIVLGSGTTGLNGYNAALRLIAAGLPSIVWFRGGEEAWQESGAPAQDRRQP